MNQILIQVSEKMVKKSGWLLTMLCVGLFCMMTVGCTGSQRKEIKDVDLVHTSYSAADALLAEAREHQRKQDKMVYLQPNKTILVASFVNIDDVQRSSTFGRMIAEQIGSRISQQGFKVIEMKLRGSVFVQKQKGELLLSRELLDISTRHNAHAVVVGTYAEGREVVYVTVKLVRAKDSIIIASHDYSLPIGVNTKRLLRTKRERL